MAIFQIDGNILLKFGGTFTNKYLDVALKELEDNKMNINLTFIKDSSDLNDYTLNGTYNIYASGGVIANVPKDGQLFGTLFVVGRGDVERFFVTQTFTESY